MRKFIFVIIDIKSSLDSTNSDESSIPTPQHCYGSVSSLISGQTNMRDHYGSISSLASSTSLISPQVSLQFGFINRTAH